MADLQVFTTTAAPTDLLEAVRRLLVAAFGDLPPEDLDHALGGWHVTALEQGALAAHAAVVPRDLEIDGRTFTTGYVEGVATAPDRQGDGLGSLVMSRVGSLIRTHFELGALSTGRHGFYERLGWERWRGPTFVRDGDRLVRTAAEEAGVMVLRFGPSRTVSLAGSISCEARPGDDW